MQTPFDLHNPQLYRQWRTAKLARAPTALDQILVEVRDPRRLSAGEREAILTRCQQCNMAVYASPLGRDDDPEIPLALGRTFGLGRLDHNWLGDGDTGLTSLTVRNRDTRRHYIPYTNHPIRWHTDGYYNTPDRWIHGLILHCVESAAQGGDNGLFDHELVYILLRDENPDYIRTLMQPDAMTIPIREGEDGTTRREQSGPVFFVTASGELHMRFTERKRNIVWKDDPLLEQAVARVKEILNNPHPNRLRGRLEPGMGLICNNVLHDRSAFDPQSDDSDRLLYRGRYYDRVAGTGFRALLSGQSRRA